MATDITHKTVFSCSQCTYTTKRKYNLERHIAMVHECKHQKDTDENQNDTVINQNDTFNDQKDTFDHQNDTHMIAGHICITCLKCFSTQSNLKRHISNGCKGIRNVLVCEFCKKQFKHRSNKYNHVKVCKEKTQNKEDIEVTEVTEQTSTTLGQVITNNGNNNTNNIQNINTQNNTYILNFNDAIDNPNFSFLKDHITTKKFEKLVGSHKPEIAFSRYMGAIMERPENRIVYKRSPNTKYCKIHNEKRWSYILDEDAFPVLTFQMTCSALEDTHKYKELIKRPKIDIVSLLEYLDDVNTENDENNNHKLSVERLKLMIINLSQQYRIPVNEISALL